MSFNLENKEIFSFFKDSFSFETHSNLFLKESFFLQQFIFFKKLLTKGCKLIIRHVNIFFYLGFKICLKGVIPLDHVAYVGSITSIIRVTPYIVLLLFTKGYKCVPYYKSRIKVRNPT